MKKDTIIQEDDFHLDITSSEPLYMQLKKALLALIQSGRLTPGMRLPDIKSIARLANTSTYTVNTALNELIRERICSRHPKKGTFVGKTRQMPTIGQPKKVCLVYHRLPMRVLALDKIRTELISGVQERCQENGVDAIFLTGNNLVNDIGFYMSQNHLEILGVILLEYQTFDIDVHVAEIYPQLRFLYFNEYSAAFELSPRNVYGIFSDDFSGGYAVGEKVASLGADRIGLLSIISDSENYPRRIAGFKQALSDHGFNLQECLVERKMSVDSNRWQSEDLIRYGSSLCRDMVQAGAFPKAVFVVNDWLAEGVWIELVKLGIEDKMNVFAYDNLFPEISRIHNFSTVDVNFQKMGWRAIDLLLSASYIPKCVFLPPQLISRIHQ